MQSPSPVDALVDALVRDTPAIAAAAADDDDDGGRRVLIGIAGVPGSGKSTVAAAAAARLVARGVAAVALPMDGFHYSRAQLDAMPVRSYSRCSRLLFIILQGSLYLSRQHVPRVSY